MTDDDRHHAGRTGEDRREPAPTAPMGSRGVTRPMALREQTSASGTEGGGGEEGMDRGEMLRMHHRQTLWIPWTFLLLGVWQLLAPVTFGHLNPELWVEPSGGRGAWWSDETHDLLRAWLMVGADLLSGVLLLVFGWRTLKPDRPVSWWVCCGVGVWLTVAPVAFWAPTAASYVNDTVVGMLLIALAILIPGMPNMIMYMAHGGDQPPGWSYNPSSWPQRWVMIVLGFAGFVVSRYLAAFQLGYVTTVWEPFFGDGTRRVLNSQMSHMWPISDGALGALSYTFEFLMGFMGASSRWRTMPWMVTFFGVLVIPLGLTHIALVMSQPVVVGAWCTLCLLAAAIMLPMIPLEVDEVVAMGQHVAAAKRRGDRGGSLWKIFWLGGSGEESRRDRRSPALVELPDRPRAVVVSSLWGMSWPWNLVASAAVGLWLMASPAVFGSGRPASAVAHLGGALAVVVAIVACGEVVRALRLVNLPVGLAIALAPWALSGATPAGLANTTVAGLALAALALRRGPVRERYGSWQRFIL